jgi:hypothetical protein
MPDKLTVLLVCIFFWSCSPPQNQEPVQEIVYEGMSKSELRLVLGEPMEIDSSGVIFDALKNKKIRIDRWKYERRTVVLMNDTVQSANENIN